MKEKKGKRGGYRGFHRAKGEPTANITIRHKKSVIDAIKEKYPERGQIARLGQAWLDSLVTNR